MFTMFGSSDGAIFILFEQLILTSRCFSQNKKHRQNLFPFNLFYFVDLSFFTIMSELENINPSIYQKSAARLITRNELDENKVDPFDEREVFGMLRQSTFWPLGLSKSLIFRLDTQHQRSRTSTDPRRTPRSGAEQHHR
jgi:hypothetical protein